MARSADRATGLAAAAYVRTLSGQERKDAVSARADEVSNTPPQTQMKREPLAPADSAEQ